MIEFEKKVGSEIPPEDAKKNLPSEEDVKNFFEVFFKKDVDQFLIYKKNQFKNPNKDVLNDFIVKLESFIKEDIKNDEFGNIINLIFKNISNDLKILDGIKCVPENKNVLSFFVSFAISKFFSWPNNDNI